MMNLGPCELFKETDGRFLPCPSDAHYEFTLFGMRVVGCRHHFYELADENDVLRSFMAQPKVVA